MNEFEQQLHSAFERYDRKTTNMKNSIYILECAALAAGVDNGVAWTSICHDATRFIYISHELHRWVSRHVTKPNKRPFIIWVRHKHNSYKLSCSATLKGAVKIAEQDAKELFTETVPKG